MNLCCHECPVGELCKGRVHPRLCELQASDPKYLRLLKREAKQEFAEEPRAAKKYNLTPVDLAAASPFGVAADDGRVRVGMLCPDLNQAGAEAHQLALMRSTAHLFNWVGLVCKQPVEKCDSAMLAQTSQLLPVAHGLDKIKDLASKCDVLVSWMTEDHARWLKGSDTPVIWIDHFPHNDVYDAVTQFCLKTVRTIVGVSELCTPGVPAIMADRYKVIWNAVDPTKLVPTRSREEMRANWGVPEGAKVAGYYSRIALDKRPDAMVRLMESLPSDWHVVLVGDDKPYPDERAYLARKISQLPEAVRVRLHLQPPDNDAGSVLNAYDVLVVPADVESFGLTMCEGLFMAIPVVATPRGMSQLHPEHFYQVALDDSGPNLAAAVRAASEHGPKPGSQEFARERFSPERFAREWSAVILAAAGRKVPTPGLLQAAPSFVKATIRHVLSGMPRASDEEIKRREEICRTCPLLVRDQCTACSCRNNYSFMGLTGLPAKRAMRDEHCHLGKW